VSDLLLLDASAIARGAARSVDDGEPCACAITRLQLTGAARSVSALEWLVRGLDELRQLRIDEATIELALATQLTLARAGRPGASTDRLLLAACARRHSATLVTADVECGALARLLGVPVRSLA
jgi:predicted nucleic acid-binding protein